MVDSAYGLDQLIGIRLARECVMRLLYRIVIIVLAGLVSLMVLAAAAVYGVTEVRLHKTYQIDAAPPAIPSDAASIERGRHLVTAVSMCATCHSSNLAAPDLAGNLFLDIPPARLGAPNLTGGAGGIGAQYTDADWARTIRHGVRPDGTPLLFMPTANFYHLSDADLGAIIAYVRSMPPVDNQAPATQIYPLGRALMAAGATGRADRPQRATYSCAAAGAHGRIWALPDHDQYLPRLPRCQPVGRADRRARCPAGAEPDAWRRAERLVGGRFHPRAAHRPAARRVAAARADALADRRPDDR